jgi:cell division protein DivIC
LDDDKAMMKKLPKAFRNFYVITLVIFLAWMLLLDSNNLVARYQLGSKLNSLEEEKEYYEEKIREVKKDRSQLFGDKESIEKFAREKYLMKKESEDIYIIVEE